MSQLPTISLPEFYSGFDRFLDGEVTYDSMWSEFLPSTEPWDIVVRYKRKRLVFLRDDETPSGQRGFNRIAGLDH